MTRVPVSVLSGSAMALLLFWLLALLVSPPEPEIEVLEMSIALTTVEAPHSEQASEPEPEAAEPVAEAAPPEPVTPPPMPEPALASQRPIALPEPELPPEAAEPLELDTTLPELSEVQPEPEPEPTPEPEPEPAPHSEPVPSPDPRPESPAPRVAESSTEPAEASRQAASAAPASNQPVDVGQVAPTSRVPPDYPARAQRRGLEGHVEVEFVIRPDGRVDPSTLRVISARPRNVFDDAARQAVARWRFEPSSGLRRARQRLEFQLR